jgi:hypothetical protein
MNGREGLARQMDSAGIDYQRQDNCFPWVSDWDQAQRLMDTQLRADWPKLLDRIAGGPNPIHDEIFQRYPTLISTSINYVQVQCFSIAARPRRKVFDLHFRRNRFRGSFRNYRPSRPFVSFNSVCCAFVTKPLKA